MQLASVQAFIEAAKQLSERHIVIATGRDAKGEYAALACSLPELLAALTAPAPAPEPAEFVTRYTTDVLNIREQASIKARKIGELPKGTEIHVIPQDKADYWPLADRPGYVHKDYLGFEAPKPPEPPPKPSDPIVVLPRQVGGGIGAHVMVGHYDTRLASYPVIKSLNDPAVLNDAHARNPKAVCIFRRHYTDAQQAVYLAEGPQIAVNRWINENQHTIMAVPFAYHEGLNEPGEVSPELVEFERLRVIELAKLGVRACVLNLGVGHTNNALWLREDVKRLIQTVIQHDGAIGLHCYAEGVISASTGAAYWRNDGTWSMPGKPLPEVIEPSACYLALRVVEDRRIIRSMGFDPLILATEMGLDDCVVPPTGDHPGNGINYPHGIQVRGWRTCIDIWRAEGWLSDMSAEQFYLRQLDWWAMQTGILGVAYAHGDTTGGDPGQFDTRGLL